MTLPAQYWSSLPSWWETNVHPASLLSQDRKLPQLLLTYFCIQLARTPRRFHSLRKRQPTPVFLCGKSHGQRNQAGYSPWGHKGVRHDLVTKQQWLKVPVLSQAPVAASPAPCPLPSVNPFLHSLMTAVVSLQGCDEYNLPSTTEPWATVLKCNVTEHCLLEVFQYFRITSWPPPHTLPCWVSLFSTSLCLESPPLFLLANSSKSFKAWVQPTSLSASLPRLPNLISKPFSAPKWSSAGPTLARVVILPCNSCSQSTGHQGQEHHGPQPYFPRAWTILAHGTWHSSKGFINTNLHNPHNSTWLLEEPWVNICPTNIYCPAEARYKF